MKVSVVGAGNVGTHLAKALGRAGHEVEMVHGHGGVPQAGRDVYVICVADSALAEVAGRVCAVAGDGLVVHTAGSVGMDVLPCACRGVLYPMQTFSKEKEVDFSHVPVFIEGGDERLEALARSISGSVARLSSAERHRLHVAAVFACNFVNHCVALADRELQSIGLDWHTVLPLLDETVEKLHHLHPALAQTGPAARGDKAVVAEHEAMIGSEAARDIYRLMSQSIAQSKY